MCVGEANAPAGACMWSMLIPARCEEAIRHVFGFAQDGRTNRQGMPSLLQLSLFAPEFDDVIRFTKPPRALQRLVFLVLAPLARWRGYRGSYPEYLTRPPNAIVEVPEEMTVV